MKQALIALTIAILANVFSHYICELIDITIAFF